MTKNTQHLPLATDWHSNGMYVVVAENGAPVVNTFDTTAYSARATHARENNVRWSQAQGLGFRLLKLLPVANLVTQHDISEVVDTDAWGIELEVNKFPEPSGDVAGVMTLMVPHGKKRHRLAHATLTVGKPPKATITFPTKVLPEQLSMFTAALALFTERLNAEA